MGFYYTSIFSIVPLGIAYGVLALIFWGIARITLGVPKRGIILAVVGVLFLVLPISEELWIAWNFGQACKEAGTFIHKKVQVDGFYDDTGASLELVRSGTYRFVEGRSDKGVTRITLGNAEFMKEALRRFQQDKPGRDPSAEDVVRVKLDEKTEALVYPRRGDSWRLERLDRPTARYHYTSENHVPEAHKVVKHQYVVTDTDTKEILGRELKYGRYAPWFFIGLDAPTRICAGARSVRGILYENVLLPVGK